MSWATITLYGSNTVAVRFAPYHVAVKNRLKALAERWDSTQKRWLVPLHRLSDVVGIFWPQVTLDYAVLVARDQALRQMLAGYMAMGIQFDVVHDKVVCDHAVLNAWFAQHSTALHVQALRDLWANPGVKRPVSAVKWTADETGLALWLRGVQNAKRRAGYKSRLEKRRRQKTSTFTINSGR